MMRPAGRLKVAIRIARIIIRVSVRIAMVEEKFHAFDRDGETKALAGSDFHVCDSDHFPRQVEERPAAVAGIYLGGGLQVKRALEFTRLRAHNSLRHRAFQSER